MSRCLDEELDSIVISEDDALFTELEGLQIDDNCEDYLPPKVITLPYE
jgi:hypothetical protein